MSGLVIWGANLPNASQTAMPSWLGSIGSFWMYFTWYRRSIMDARVALVPSPSFSISWMSTPWE